MHIAPAPPFHRGRIVVDGLTGSVLGVNDGGDELLCKCWQNKGVAIEDSRPGCQFLASQIYIRWPRALRISLHDYGRGPGCASSLNVSSLPLRCAEMSTVRVYSTYSFQ